MYQDGRMILFISEEGWLVGNGRLAALDDLGQVVDYSFISDRIGYVSGWLSDFVYFRRKTTGRRWAAGSSQ